jgi:hypothetical protein
VTRGQRSSWSFSRRLLTKIVGRKLEKLGNSLDIPIGERDINMAEIRGQLWQFARDVQSGTIPFDKSPSRKAVSKILQTRSMAIAAVLSCFPQADRTGYIGKHAAGGTTQQSLAVLANEERLGQPKRTEFVATICIALKRPTSRLFNRNEARLPELRFSD